MSDNMRWVIQLSLGFTFGLSAFGKLRDPLSFVRGVRDYKIVPNQGAGFFAVCVIVSELFLSISYISEQMLRFAAPLGCVLLSSFGVAVIVNLVRHRNLACFCFGSDDELISGRTLARLGTAILGQSILIFQPGFFSVQSGRVFLAASAREEVLALVWTAFLLIAIMWLLDTPDLLDLAKAKFSAQLADPSDPETQGGTTS